MATEQGERKEHLRTRLMRGREVFLAAVAALDEVDMAKPVQTDGATWAARDLVGHVAYAEVGMVGLIRATLAGAPPQADPAFDLDRFNEGRVRRAREQEFPALLERLAASREAVLVLLDGLTDADLDRAAHHPVLRETTVEGIFRVMPLHDRQHAQDLAALRGTAT